MFEIWSIFGYHHASSSGRHLFDVRTPSNCGFRWLGLHIWWQMIWRHPILWSTTHLMPYWGIFCFTWDFQVFMELHAYFHLRGTHQDDDLFVNLSWSPSGAPLEPFGQTHTFWNLDVVMLFLRDTSLLIRGFDSTVDLDYWDQVIRWWMIWCHLTSFRSIIHLCPIGAYFHFS